MPRCPANHTKSAAKTVNAAQAQGHGLRSPDSLDSLDVMRPSSLAEGLPKESRDLYVGDVLILLEPIIDFGHFSKVSIGKQAKVIEIPPVQVSDARRQKMPGLPFRSAVPGELLKRSY